MRDDVRPGNYPTTLSAPVNHSTRSLVEAEAKRQGVKAATLMRALALRAVEEQDRPDANNYEWWLTRDDSQVDLFSGDWKWG